MEDFKLLAEIYNHMQFIAAGYGIKLTLRDSAMTISNDEHLSDEEYAKFEREIDDYLLSKGVGIEEI